jgi:hypothetical protein
MVGDIFRAVASYSGVDNQLRQWVWHYIQAIGGATDNDLLAAAILAILDLAWADIEDHIHTSVIGTDLQLLKWDAGAGEYNGVAIEDLSHQVGLGAADVMPGNVSPYVIFPTSLPRSTGKKKLFDVVEAQVTEGAIAAGLLADMGAFALHMNNIAVESGNSYRAGNHNPDKPWFQQWSLTTVGVGVFSGSEYQRLVGRGA